MSTIVTKNVQIGSDSTASNNFTVFQPTVPDGTLRIGNGNSGATSSAITINSSGNVGLGVTPSAWASTWRAFEFGAGNGISSDQVSAIHVTSNAYWNGSSWIYKTSNNAANYYSQNGIHYWRTAPSGTAGNAISFTQAMTLDASGNLLVGTTSAGGKISVYQSGATWGQTIDVAQTAVGPTYYQIQFQSAGNISGSITSTTSTVSYNTSSDYRLKNITGPITTSGAFIDSLNPVEGTWKSDGSTFVGLIAHEVQEVSRTNVVTGVKDGEEMQAMDYSNAELIANLIAEIKSLRTRVAALETK